MFFLFVLCDAEQAHAFYIFFFSLLSLFRQRRRRRRQKWIRGKKSTYTLFAPTIWSISFLVVTGNSSLSLLTPKINCCCISITQHTRCLVTLILQVEKNYTFFVRWIGWRILEEAACVLSHEIWRKISVFQWNRYSFRLKKKKFSSNGEIAGYRLDRGWKMTEKLRTKNIWIKWCA